MLHKLIYVTEIHRILYNYLCVAYKLYLQFEFQMWKS